MPSLCEFVVMVLIIKEIWYHLRRRKISLCQAQNAVPFQESQNSWRILIRTETYPDLDYCDPLSHNSINFNIFLLLSSPKICIHFYLPFMLHTLLIPLSLFKQPNTIFSTMHSRKAPIYSFLQPLVNKLRGPTSFPQVAVHRHPQFAFFPLTIRD